MRATDWTVPGKGAPVDLLAINILAFLGANRELGAKLTGLRFDINERFDEQDAMRAAEAIRKALAGEQ